MNTLLSCLYDLLSFISENERKALPEQFVEPIKTLMTLLEEYLD